MRNIKGSSSGRTKVVQDGNLCICFGAMILYTVNLTEVKLLCIFFLLDHYSLFGIYFFLPDTFSSPKDLVKICVTYAKFACFWWGGPPWVNALGYSWYRNFIESHHLQRMSNCMELWSDFIMRIELNNFFFYSLFVSRFWMIQLYLHSIKMKMRKKDGNMDLYKWRVLGITTIWINIWLSSY